MKKRVLSMLMTLALCLTLLPTPAWAAEDTPEGGAIVQQEQQEEISPAVSEQAGTNEDENGAEGDPQNTGTPDAGGAEDSKADAPENGEDENAGNNADAAVSAVQTMIDALPTVSELDGMTAGELDAAYNDIQAAYDAYEALNAEQQAQITGADFEALLGWFNSQTAPQADAQSGVHTHCVCGKDSSTTVNGHTHNTGTTWTATDALPSTAGSYYLTQSVTADWTVPTGEVNLCLNGQTINGKITVGGGATLTLTDCSGNGKVQGEVTVNGGKFELYSGTITGGVQVGIKGTTYQTGSSFTMYGGAIIGNRTDSGSGGGVFLVGTTNHIDPPSFTMHGGTISNNTAGASDGGGGGVYVGEKCSFTMDGGTITGNTATAGNGGGIYIHFNAGNVSISNATITGNKASATGNISYGHGGGIYSQRGVTVENVTITGNNSTYEGGGIYGKGAITLTDATVTDNNQYDVYYDGKESTTPELTVSGSVKAGYYANYDWKLPILVSGALSEDSVIRVGVREGINPGAIAEPASGVTLRAENFKADAADCVTSLGDDGKVYLVPCTHEMDDTGYTCKKCHTQFDARVGDSAYYQTLTKAFDAARGSTVTLLRDVTLTENCSSSYIYPATLDLNGKTVSSERYYISVGGGNKPTTLTVKDSGTGGGTQALDVTFYVSSNGTLAVEDSYTGEISRVELQAGGALERFGGEIGELVLSNAAAGSTSTGYNLKLWNGNTNACTIGKITDNTKSKSLTVNDLLGTDYAKCELYGEKDGAWSIVPKTEKISELTGYTAYKVQFTECVHQCADDSNPVCSVCHKDLYTKITAKAADGTTKTAYFTEDSALENGYVEAIQTLNGWSDESCTEPTLTLLRDMPYGTSITLTGTLTLEGGTHTAKNVTVAENADVTFASGSYQGATIDGTATVETGVTFTDASVTVNGTLNAKGGTFDGRVEFNGSSTANISGGSFNCEKNYGGVTFDYNVTGTISGGTFAFADFYTTKVKLSGGTFTTIKTNGDRKLADLLAEGAAYYNGDSAVSDDNVSSLANVTVKSHEHNGGTDGKGTCSICGKQMAASLTAGGKTSWYTAFASAIEAANAADGAKTITLYQNVDDTVYGKRTAYELTRGPVTLATGGKRVDGVDLIAKGISLTVTGSNGSFYVTVDGKDAELTVNDKDTKLAIVTAKNGGKLSLSNGTFSRVDVMNDGSSASLSGGSYGEITSGTNYVKPYALLAKGYAYKKEDNTWVSNANIGLSKVTVEKAPFAVEKIYPNSDTNYTGNSAFATDGNIKLTAVIAPETEGVTYYYWWELFDESTNDWTTQFSKVNAATHDGKQSKTLTISGLPVDKSYQYHIFVQCSNGYNCYSEPFTVTQHQHSWTYSASGATITAKCTAEGCYLTDGNGGSVTIAPPAELTYSGESKPATVTASSDWQGPAASEITISYIKTGMYGPEALENGALPTKAGEYTASITVGEGNKAATASVKYTIQKANPVVTEWPTLSAPVYVNSEATLTGGSGEGTFDFKAGAAKSWDSAGRKTTTIVFIPTYTNNYNELTKDYPVTVVKRTVKNCNTLVGITDKPCGTAQDELGLPGTVTITTVDGKTFNDIPVTWSGYDPNTLKEQTLTGTLDLTSIAGEVEQPSTPVTAQIKVKLTQKHFSGISPVSYEGEYDGNAHGITLTGVPSGATVKYGTSANSCTKDSLTYTDFTNGAQIVFYKVSQSGYADASGNAWVNITKRPLTVTGITANGKVYDGTTNATLDCSKVVLDGVLENDTLTVTAKGMFEKADVGEQKVTISDLTLDGNSANNYVLAESGNQTETTATITAKEVTVTITPNGGTYGSVVAAAAKLTGAVKGENVPVTLTYTGNGYNDTAVPVNAGSYTVTASIANSNYTLTGNTTADFVITPKAVTVTGITAKDKVYDGTKNADISSVTFDNVTLNRGTDYTVTASFDDAGVGNGKSITAAVTLTEQASKNYALQQSRFMTTGNITKAAAPDFAKETALAIINGYKKTYTVTLPALPTLETPKEYGAPTYELGEIKLNDGYYTSGAKVENGELTLPIQKNDVGTTGPVGTVTVVIKSKNYEDITLTVKVNAANKIEPTPDGTITASEITYGDALSKSTISGKMKDPNTGDAVTGTFAWTDGTIKPDANDNYKAEWTFTPAAGYEKYATATGTVTIKVNKATPTFTAPIAQENLTYTGQEQALIIAGSVTDYGTMQYSLTKNGTYSQDIPTGTDAGKYTVWYRVIGDANHYDTAPASVAVSIGKKPLTITGVTAESKPYDGTTNADITSVTFDNVTLNRGTDYTVTANFDEASVGDGKNVTATVTLMGQTAKNYALEQSSFPTTGNITKAAIDPSDIQLYQTVFNDLAKTYKIDLNQFLDTILPEGGKYGDIQYGKPSVFMNSDYYPVGGATIGNGNLSLSINKAASSNQGDEIGTVTVQVETTNYQPFTLTIHVSLQDKLVPVLAKGNTVSATDITYGQTLADSNLTVNGTMQDSNTGAEVKGTFTWTDGTIKPAANDSYDAEWTFTPAADYEKYATVTGTVTVKVKPAKLIVSVKASSMYYTGKEQIASIIASGQSVDSTPVTFTYSDKVDGNYTSGVPTFTDAGTYTAYYKAEAANHEPATGKFTVTIDPLPISLLSVSSISKTYDGSADVTLTADKLTFFSKTAKATNIKLPDTALTFSDAQFTSKQEDGSYLPSPEVGNGKALSFTMTLTSNNYVFEGKSEGTTKVSDVFATDDVNRFTITKAAAPTMQPIELTIYNGVHKTYSIDLSTLLPKLTAPCDYGTITYDKKVYTNLGVGSFITLVNGKTGELTLEANRSGTDEGQFGTITVTISTSNYQDITLTVKVSAVNQITPVPEDGKITASKITYGQALSDSTITGTMQDPNTREKVTGTFTWVTPDEKLKAGSHNAEWIFTPDESNGGKYTTNNGTATVTVNRKTVTVSGITAKDKAYDGTTNAVLDYSAVTLGGVLKNDTLTVTATGTLESAGVGEQKVTISDLTLGGASAANYVLAESGNQSETTATITAKEVTITITSKGGTYGSVVAAAAKLTGVVDGDNVPVTLTYTGNNYSSATVPVNAGSYTVTASIANSNYTLTGNTTAAFVIAPKAVTVSGITAKDKVYDGTNDATLDCSNAKFDGILKNDKLTVAAKGMFEKADIGKQKVTISDLMLGGASAANYVLAESGNQTETTATITAKEVTVTITSKGGTYGSVVAAAAKLSGAVDGENVPVTLTYIGNNYSSATVPVNVGSYTVTASIANSNYTLTGNTTADFVITPKAVTVSSITANDKVYDGTTNAVLDYSNAQFDGILENDKLTVAAKGVFEKAEAGKQNVAISDLKLGGDSAANYVLAESGNQTETTATITAKEVTVTPDNKSKVYKEKDPDLTYKVDGVLDGETLKGITLTRAEGENAGEYDITGTADAGANPNYDVTFAEGTFTIEPKSIKGAKVVLGKGLAANGAEQTQTVEKVLLGDKEIPADSYTVSGNTATAHGIYTLTVTGKGNYKDSVKWTYVIAPAKAEDAPGEDIAISSGKVKVDVQSEGTVPPATLLTDKAELLAMLVNSGDITADELAQIADGASVDIVLTVKEANAPDEVKTAMAQAAKDYTIGQYLDISLFKYMTVNGSQQAGVALHTTKDALTISVVVPNALVNTNSAVNRTYCIVRNHEGTITVLDAAFDAASKTLTFKTDRFSDYAIAYKDTAVPSSGSNPGSNNSSNDSETKKNEVAAPTPAPTPASTSKPSTITAMPQTGDTSNPTLYVVLLVASLLGLAVVFVCKKRNDK